MIPVRDDLERLRSCLDALARQSLPQDRFEVLVIDNGSVPPVQLRACSDNVSIHREDRPGSYVARNTGVRLARGDVLAFTDSDCVPDPEWLANGLDIFAREPGCHAIAGHVAVYARDAEHPTVVELFEMVFGFPQQHYANALGFGVTANLMVLREAFDQVGPFDASLPSGGDREWGNRAARAGLVLRYAPGVRVAHPARASWGQIRAKCRRVAYGEYLLLRDGRTSRAAYCARWFKPPLRKAFRAWRSHRGTVTSRLSLAAMAVGIHYLQLHDVARWHAASLIGRTG